MTCVLNRPFDQHVLRHGKNRREAADCYPEHTNGRTTCHNCVAEESHTFPTEDREILRLWSGSQN